MKKIYDISHRLSDVLPLSLDTIYMLLRTLAVFVPSLILALLLKDFIHLPATTPTVFVVLFSGWITLIFGYCGGLLYLMRRD